MRFSRTKPDDFCCGDSIALKFGTQKGGIMAHLGTTFR